MRVFLHYAPSYSNEVVSELRWGKESEEVCCRSARCRRDRCKENQDGDCGVSGGKDVRAVRGDCTTPLCYGIRN